MSLSENLRERLQQSRVTVEKELAGLPMFRSGGSQAENCSYSLSAGGKRLRPFLVLESSNACGGQEIDALPAACAVEMIHTYSLIHDDLPGMDDDDLRRGKPTLHRICGVPGAIKAGDRLLIEAFRVLLGTALPSDTVRVMTGKLASAAGASWLVGGQFMDMYHPAVADRTWTERMIGGKTSAMIRVSMELGVLSAGLSPGELAPVSSIGDDIGWLFQLTDDILDVTGNQEELGKAVAKDADQGKWNPVTELGLEKAVALAVDTSEKICLALEALPGNWAVVQELVEYLPERRK